MYCVNYRMLAVGTGASDTLVTRLRCKQWSCAYCAYINRVQWHMRVLRTMEHNDWWPAPAFITFTAPAWAHDEGKTLRVLQTGLSKIYDRLRYHNRAESMFGQKIDGCPYVRVFEQHKSGAWHMHYLAWWRRWHSGDVRNGHVLDCDSCEICADESNNKSVNCVKCANDKFLKKHAVACGYGWRVDWRPVRYQYDSSRSDTPTTQAALQIASYITKYMTKDIQGIVEKHRYKRMRQIQATQEFKPEYAVQFEEGEQRNWRVQSRYRYSDWVQDVKPVQDVQTRSRISAVQFDPKFDNIYDDLLQLRAAEIIDNKSESN
jgi:hypothetical protein